MHSPRLNLTQIATLREFVRRGTLAAAADHLGYTTGAVSQHLSTLEEAVGVALTQRSGRQLILTDAGRLLADYASRLLDLEAEALTAARSLNGQAAGPLLVGTWGSAAVGLLSPIVERMASDYPDVQITSRELDLDEVTSAVRHGDVDVAFGLDYLDLPMSRDPAMVLTQLHQETFAVAVGVSGPYAVDAPSASRTVTTDQLAAFDWILPPETSHYGRAVRAGLRRHGFEPRVVHEVTDTAASLQLAASGLGATLMTDLMHGFHPTLDLTALAMDDPLTRRIVLVARGGVTAREGLRVFVQVARQLVDELPVALMS